MIKVHRCHGSTMWFLVTSLSTLHLQAEKLMPNSYLTMDNSLLYCNVFVSYYELKQRRLLVFIMMPLDYRSRGPHLVIVQTPLKMKVAEHVVNSKNMWCEYYSIVCFRWRIHWAHFGSSSCYWDLPHPSSCKWWRRTHNTLLHQASWNPCRLLPGMLCCLN